MKLKNIFALLFVFLFLFSTLGLDNVHRILHHLGETTHTHSLTCLADALAHGVPDEYDFSAKSRLKEKSCATLQFLQLVPRFFKQTSVVVEQPILHELQQNIATLHNQILKQTMWAQSFNSRGPPQP